MAGNWYDPILGLFSSQQQAPAPVPPPAPGPMLAANDTSEGYNAQDLHGSIEAAQDRADDNADQIANQANINAQNSASQEIPPSPELDQLLQNSFKQRANDTAATRAQLEGYLKQNQQVNASPIMGLIDAWTGSHLAKDYNAPTSPEERQRTIAGLQGQISKENTGLTEDQIKYMSAKARAEALAKASAAKAGAPSLGQDRLRLRTVQLHEKLQNDADDALNPNSPKSGAMHSWQEISNKIGRINNFADSIKKLENGKLDPTKKEYRELATIYAQSLGGGNTTLEQINGITADDALAKFNDELQYWVGHPEAGGLQEFASRLMANAQATKDFADKNVKEIQFQNAGKLQVAQKEIPDIVAQSMKRHGFNPNEYDADGHWLGKASAAKVAPPEPPFSKADVERGAKENKKSVAEYSDFLKSQGHTIEGDSTAARSN